MAQGSAPEMIDSERAEVGIVVNALARNPRLAELLTFVADKYFSGQTDDITEFNIATEVFGRSKNNFVASQDSIARVEAYRLRKKLKEYYESEGKDHTVWISLPSGSYIPIFTHHAAAEASASEVCAAETAQVAQNDSQPSIAPVAYSPRSKNKALIVGALTLAALLLAALGLVFWRRNHIAANIDAPSANDVKSSPAPNAAQAPIRLLAGYSGAPRTDNAGALWMPDRYFNGGVAAQRPAMPIYKTSNPMLFERWRTGDFSYDIPLAPGAYELHLYFVGSQSDDIGEATFHVKANGKFLLQGFDIGSDALGPNIADERVFKDISPDKDGLLHLAFSMERAAPTLNAIEILPSKPHRQLPVRLVMQKTAVTDKQGNQWKPDDYYQSGRLSDPPRQVEGAPDPSLYATERYGHFTYAIPVDASGSYTVVLHFAELYFGQQSAGYGGANSRVFRITCNGSTLVENLDIFKEAGSLHALTKTFRHVQPTREGKLNLTFEPKNNFATVSAIEVIDEAE